MSVTDGSYPARREEDHDFSGEHGVLRGWQDLARLTKGLLVGAAVAALVGCSLIAVKNCKEKPNVPIATKVPSSVPVPQ